MRILRVSAVTAVALVVSGGLGHARSDCGSDPKSCERTIELLQGQLRETTIRPLKCAAAPGVAQVRSDVEWSVPEYVTRAGDTLSEIAKRFRPRGWNYAPIMEYHNSRAARRGTRIILDPDKIEPGIILQLPTCAYIREYWVRRGYERGCDPYPDQSEDRSGGRQNRASGDQKHGQVLFGQVNGSVDFYPLAVEAARCMQQNGLGGEVALSALDLAEAIKKICRPRGDIAVVGKVVTDIDGVPRWCRDDLVGPIVVAGDAVTVIYNKANPVLGYLSNLDISTTSDELENVLANRGSWAEIAHTIGARGYRNSVDAEVRRYYPDRDSLTLRAVVDFIHDSTAGEKTPSRQDRNRNLIFDKMLRTTSGAHGGVTIRDLAAPLIESVQSDPMALGIVRYSELLKFFPDDGLAGSNINLFRIEGGDPRKEAGNRDKYLMVQPMAIYTTQTNLRDDRQRICRLINGLRDHARSLALAKGYIPPNVDQQDESEQILRQHCGGDRYDR